MAARPPEIQAIIESNFAGDDDIFAVTTKSFLANLDQSLKEYRSAVKSRDCAKIRAAAHRLSGDTSLFHRPEVCKVFRSIEDSAKSGVATESQVNDEAERALEGLKAELVAALQIS